MNRKTVILTTLFLNLINNTNAMENGKYVNASQGTIEKKLVVFQALKSVNTRCCSASSSNQVATTASTTLFSRYPNLPLKQQLIVIGVQACCPLSTFFVSKKVERYLDSEIKNLEKELEARKVKKEKYE